MGTPTSVTIVWRTTSPSDTRLRYGTELGALDQEVLSPAEVTDHVVTLTGLLPATRYYYEVGSTLQVEAGNDADHFFVTSPEPGTEVDFTAWIVGDSGTGGSNQASVRDAMLAATAGNPPDLFLHVGDIAYSDGTEQQYTEHHFEPYRDILRHTVFWPARGNHDGREGYLNAFVLPAGGEAGGVPSGTEEYYSFDHANTHFVVLDSQGSDREPGSPMLEWLANDLAENTQRWLIAYFHHPPYSKGKHDSDDPGDSGGRLIDMRENAMPILEAAGVDLVLAGHSHTYERSYLIDQVYGFGEAPAFRTPDFDTLLHGGNILDAGDGDPDGDGAYEKSPGLNPHDGTVYVVAGHGGKSVEADGEHPVMIFTEIEFGSALLRIDGDVLTLDNLRADGVVSDRFAIVKGEAPPACTDDAECDDGIACTDDVCNPVRGCLNADACSGVRFCNADTGVCEVETLVSFQNGTDGYAGAQDTYVSASSPDAVNGDKPEIRWDLENPNGSGFSDHALLRFDAIFGSAPGRIPVGATIESAILELVMTNPTELPDGAVYESLVPWSESSTTHGDFGGDAGVQPDELGAFVAAAPVGEEPCPAPCALPIQLDVTSSLQRWAEDPASNSGWVVVPGSGDRAKVASTEHIPFTDRPRLTVRFAPPDCTVDADCDDGLYCNGAEACAAGTCVAGTPLACDDGLGCTLDTCDEAADRCEHVPDDALCDDGLYCNGAEACAAGTCVTGTPVACDDGVACTLDACDEAADRCEHAPDDGLCDDGLYCNGAETCDAALDCQSGTEPCSDAPCDEAANFCGALEVSLEEVGTGAASATDVVSTDTTLAPGAGALYLAALSARPLRSVTGVTGLGLDWVEVEAQCSGRAQTGVSLWMAQGTPAAPGAVTASLDAAADSAAIAVSRYAGVRDGGAIGAIVSANTNGPVGACSGGADNASYSVDLTTTTAGAVVYGAAAARNRIHAPGDGFAEWAEIQTGSGGNVASVAVQDRTVDLASTVPVDGSLSGNTDWAVVGVEILPGAVEPPPEPAEIVLEEVHSATASDSRVVITPTDVSAVPGDLYLATLSYRPQRTVITVLGLNLSWEELATQCSGRDQTAVSVWVGRGEPLFGGRVVGVLDADATSAVMAVTRYSGAGPDELGQVVTANSNGVGGACTGGTDGSGYSLDLPVGAGSVAFGAAAMRTRSHEPGADLTERVEVIAGTGGAAASTAVQDREVSATGSVVVDGSFDGSTDWAAVAIEIRPAAQGQGSGGSE
jgi:hypothetical protein